MILVSIDFSNNDVCMVSIPRDSYVKIYNANGNVANPSSPYSKINNAFSEGGGAQKKGFEYSIATVEKLMGVNIGYYCGFNMNVVKEVVNPSVAMLQSAFPFQPLRKRKLRVRNSSASW